MSQKNKKLDNPELLPPQGLSRYKNIMHLCQVLRKNTPRMSCKSAPVLRPIFESI